LSISSLNVPGGGADRLAAEVDAATPAASPAERAPVRGEREVQRAAVAELISLAARSADEESAAEREYSLALQQAGARIDARRQQIAQSHATATAAETQNHQQQLQQLAADFASERARLSALERAERKAFEHQKQEIDEALRKKLDQAIWLAESVLEMTANAAAAAHKATADAVETAHAALNRLEIDAANAVQRFGVPLPTDAPAVSDGQAQARIAADPDAALPGHRAAAEQRLAELSRLPVAGLFVGLRPYLFGLLLIVVAVSAVVGVQAGKGLSPAPRPIAIAAGSALLLSIVVGLILRRIANRRVLDVYLPLRVELALARQAAEQQLVLAAQLHETTRRNAQQQRAAEVQAARDMLAPLAAKAARDRDAGIGQAGEKFSTQITAVTQSNTAAVAEAAAAHRAAMHQLQVVFQRDRAAADSEHVQVLAAIEQRYAARNAALQQSWSDGLRRIAAPIEPSSDSAEPAVATPLDWSDPAWKNWKPPRTFASRVTFGQLHADLRQIAPSVPVRLSLPPSFALPALLVFPAQASLLIDTDHAGRPDAIRTLQMLMARLLTSLPAGRVRFTLFDPVGLGQNFAGFMHLADYDDQLVGGRIWTSQEQIDQRLADLTDHMETVIQKYLRNEFETIDAYNAQAGELAEPYRFLVIADLPVNFTAESFRRLTSIAASGARCGVYTLVVRDTRAPLPPGAHLDELRAHSVHLVRREARFIWNDDVFRQLPLTLNPAPPEDVLTAILHRVGAAAKESKRVEVPFETIAPPAEKQWMANASAEVNVPIGRLGANRLQSLKLGRGVAQHVLIAGKTGSGKSTLLHAMITNAALWYSPDELELYLIDFKKGVEFKSYANHLLPHARAIAVESDREFGLSVLQRLDVELARRGELFRKAGVQDLAGYRKTAGAQIIPRTLLMIDEFQEFFTEDDKLAQESALLIDRLVRQGRAFGVHVLLGSQTIGGAGGLPRSTLGQMAVRIALQTSEADSQLILGDNNSAARLLTRPGEAIYNDAGGLVEGNSPFQVAWLADEKRDIYLRQLAAKAAPYFARFGRPIVFEGNSFADLRQNAALAAALASAAIEPAAARAWLGEPVAIKDPTSVVFRRQAGAHLLIVGQQDEQAMALMAASILSLAAQQNPQRARFIVMDGTSADSSLAGKFARVAAPLPHEVRLVEWRNTEAAITELADELARRQESAVPGPSIYLLLYGMQRYRQLRKSEDDFSFSTSDEPKKPNTSKQFADILRDGPALGVHVLAWADTMATLDRTLDRASLREFDHRVLFQMSANDSSNLIDSPAANKLGFFRALLFSEEQGVSERFRPYAWPEAGWHRTLAAALTANAAAARVGNMPAA
jgi:S-DNA-T family DNA segregation ATPase FtsK/SpoIIIE